MSAQDVRADNSSKFKAIFSKFKAELDRCVEEVPVWTFVAVAVISAATFVALYWAVGKFDLGGFKLNDVVTNYVGSLIATVVALAGALVSVMLARLALKLGHEAKNAAERANEIQEQMRKYEDPRLVEARESQKLAEQLDRQAESLRKYSAVAFSSLPRDQPIGEIRFAYQRCSEFLSDSALYRYCSKLVGEAEAEKLFSSMEARIFEAKRALGYDESPDRPDAILTSRNAEKVAMEISRLLPKLERAKQAASQADQGHGLHKLALDLEWKSAMHGVSCCERAADGYFRGATSRVAGIVVASRSDPDSQRPGEPAVVADALLRTGQRSVIHVLETDLKELIRALGSPQGAAALPQDGAETVRHDSLRDFVIACYEDKVGTHADVIIAGWDSTLKDEPKSVTYDELYRPWEQVASTGIGLESTHLWDKAIFLARNSAFERVIGAALRNLEFLREMKVEDVTDNLHDRQGIDPADMDDEARDKEWRLATRSAKRLRYIHAAIEDLRQVHASKGAVVVPDSDPYAALKQVDGDRAIIVVRPYFARIDMSLPGSEWKQQNEWFEDYVGGYAQYRWDGGRH